MKLVVAVGLLLLVTIPPVPGQAPDQPANKGSNPKGTSSGQQQPAQRVPSAPKVKSEPSPDSEGGGPEQKNSDDPVSISTVKPLDVRADVQKDWMDKLNWVFAATLVLIGGGGVYAAVRTLKAIERQAELMERQATEARESTAQQGRDVQASIAEATRSARAMEGIAESMASNVESVRESVGISREIADTQKLVTELQSRAYLSVAFNTALFQDANHVFEVQAIMHNRGNTPAYDVTFSAVAGIIAAPIPDDFEFPLPDNSAGASVSFLAPGTHKLITRSVLGRVHDDEVNSIKRDTPPRCLAMWGVVRYRDAFEKSRQLRFAFSVGWIPWIKGMDKDKDGNPLLEQQISHDTTHHNDAD